MQGFFKSLTEDESALLAHVTMQYLDNCDREFDALDRWDYGYKRVEHPIEIQGTPLTVEGFTKSHYERTMHRKESFSVSKSALALLANVANYQQPRESISSQVKVDPSAAQAHGVLYCGHRSGDFQLFDHPIIERNAMSISLADAMLMKGGLGTAVDPVSISDGRQLWEIELSQEQFVRMIRGEYAEVPCTISHNAGYRFDPPDTSYLEQVKIHDETAANIRSVVSDLELAIDAVLELTQAGAITSKKRLAEFKAAIQEVEAQWEKVKPLLADCSQTAISAVKQDVQNRLLSQVEKEIDALPAPEKAQVMRVIQGL